jgi:hypothetical protein
MDFLNRRLLVVLACLALPAFGQTNRTAEAQIKAAYLYKFGSFVEWPGRAFERAETPFTIGLLGADTVAAELEQVAPSRSVQGRPLAVRKLKRGEPLAGLHVLFVGSSESARIADILGAAKGQPLLVVSESDDGLAQGSMINFVAIEGKVRFDVALPPAEEGKLKISARLLAVARKVISS